MPDAPDRLKAALSDRYAIEREIGQGGMATVYLAQDLKHDRKVALKVLQPELAAVMGSERFLREIETLAGLRHPHILPLYDSGDADGLLYYVMPFVEGESLGDRLARETQLPVDEALTIAREAAGALAYAHERGIIHRDIKPDNIMLEGGHAVVADFGIARAIGEAGGDKLTQTGMAVGTPQYMSPEQAGGQANIDARSDVYALAAVLYEMLAGEAPYTGPTLHVVLAKSLTDPIPSIRRIRPAVPESVDTAITKALERTPADRHPTVAAFAEALEAERVGVRKAGRAGPLRWKPWAAAVAVAVVGAGAVYAIKGIAGWTGGDAAAANRETVSVVLAVAPTEDEDLPLSPAAMRVALERGLVESPYVTPLGLPQVQEALEVMERDPEAPLDDQTALEVAFRTGAGGVVTPRVTRVGSGFLLSASILDPEGVVMASPTANAATEDALLPALDTLSLEIRRALGESEITLEQSRSLTLLLTPSLEALRLYVEAEPLMRTDARGALALLNQAIEIDPDFAVAHAGVAGALIFDNGDFFEPLERAFEMVDRLAPDLQFLIGAFGTQFLERDHASTAEILQAGLDAQLSQESVDPFFTQATIGLLMSAHEELGDRERTRALQDLWFALADSGTVFAAGIWQVQAFQLANAGDATGMEAALERHESEEGPDPHGFATVYAALPSWDRAAEVLREPPPSNWPTDRLRIPALLGTVEAVRGRPAASRAAFAEALFVAVDYPDTTWVPSIQLEQAAAELFALNDPVRARAALEPILALTPPETGRLRRYYAKARALAAATCVATSGEIEATVDLACAGGAPTDSIRDYLETAERQAWEALAVERFEDAILLGNDERVVRGGSVGRPARLAGALAYERVGQPDAAAALYENFVRMEYGYSLHAAATYVMRSIALRRLVTLGGEAAQRAREQLERDWAEAESEFLRDVADPLLGGR